MHDLSFFFFNPLNTTPKQQTGYSKLANLLSKDALYYSLVAPFFLFYLAFDVFIYPNRDRLHPAVAPSGTPLEVCGGPHLRLWRESISLLGWSVNTPLHLPPQLNHPFFQQGLS